MGQDFWKKTQQFFQFDISLQQASKLVSKYGDLMLPGAFLDKVTPDIDFTSEVVVQCDVPVVKILL